jgi:ubiquinone/menaquinone biosynthesis C-methylase UbiE
VIDLAELYARRARRFDAVRQGSRMELPYLKRTAALSPPPGEVLDLGCGSGEPIARFFVEQGYRVTGVDAAREMLQLCRARFPEMTWIQADMRALDLPERFDVVIAWDSFFHLGVRDQRVMFERFRRLTAPGGVLVFTSGTTEGEGVSGDLFGDQLYHGSLDTDEYAGLLSRHGYQVALHRERDPDCGGHTVWIARLGGPSG